MSAARSLKVITAIAVVMVMFLYFMAIVAMQLFGGSYNGPDIADCLAMQARPRPRPRPCSCLCAHLPTAPMACLTLQAYLTMLTQPTLLTMCIHCVCTHCVCTHRVYSPCVLTVCTHRAQPGDGRVCTGGINAHNQPLHFDYFIVALANIFTVATTENWIGFMWTCYDTNGAP